jgi:hypothetical protein
LVWIFAAVALVEAMVMSAVSVSELIVATPPERFASVSVAPAKPPSPSASPPASDATVPTVTSPLFSVVTQVCAEPSVRLVEVFDRTRGWPGMPGTVRRMPTMKPDVSAQEVRTAEPLVPVQDVESCRVEMVGAAMVLATECAAPES